MPYYYFYIIPKVFLREMANLRGDNSANSNMLLSNNESDKRIFLLPAFNIFFRLTGLLFPLLLSLMLQLLLSLLPPQ